MLSHHFDCIQHHIGLVSKLLHVAINAKQLHAQSHKHRQLHSTSAYIKSVSLTYNSSCKLTSITSLTLK